MSTVALLGGEPQIEQSPFIQRHCHCSVVAFVVDKKKEHKGSFERLQL